MALVFSLLFCIFFLSYDAKKNPPETILWGIEKVLKYKHIIFFHPDYTVGTGVTPVHAYARGLSPPIRNLTCPKDYVVVLRDLL
jgi:hypothetical protein